MVELKVKVLQVEGKVVALSLNSQDILLIDCSLRPLAVPSPDKLPVLQTTYIL